ncbi:MAG: acyl-CoA desaturase [Bacteroidia bacterium]|nr:acyl-CoA desaturase [Bacteroidia bacterium]
MEIIIFFVAHWYLSLFTQTFFHHRYSAHKMFTMTKFWEKFFFLISFIFQGSSYLSPNAYGILHRLHHAYADTEKDPHSPMFSKNLFDMMYKTKVIYSALFRGTFEYEERFSKELPEWRSFELFAVSYPVRISWGIGYFIFYYHFATEWWMYLLLPVHFIMGPIHGAIINWFSHKIGYISYKLSNTSTNLLPFDFLMLGEGYHNNHHMDSTDPNFGKKWHEFDPIYPFILLFNFLGIIRLRKA